MMIFLMFFGITLIGNNDAALKGHFHNFFIYDSSATLKNKTKQWLNQERQLLILFLLLSL